MKVYLTASISQNKEFGLYYKKIYEVMKKVGYNVYSGHLFQNNSYREEFQDQKAREYWYKEAIRKITESDLVVVEISHPSSANVGHELSSGLDKGKPVIALYREDRNPIFLQGMINERLFLVPYTDDDLESVLKNALTDAVAQMDVRFNFFISPKIGAYLDWVSKNKKLPRAVYLRKLIEDDMMKSDYEAKKEDKTTKTKPIKPKKK